MSHEANTRVAEAQKEREDELEEIKRQNAEMMKDEILVFLFGE